MCHVSCKRGHDKLDIKAMGAVKVLLVVLETVDFLVEKVTFDRKCILLSFPFLL